AAGYISRYFERYSGVKKFLDAMVEQAHKDGFVTTMFGRRRNLPAIRSSNFNQRSLAERMAMNTPIQGSAADIIKLAMVAAWRELGKAGVRSRILLQVHDELVLEVAEEEIGQVSEILRKAMEHVVELSVPLVIDIHTGKNWAEAK
ncbi:MAG: DNA polymerase I, partial [Selenomonadaceae bacterium]|nr:DNA polymerase I [Selenomonadaceae bacterium]